MPDRYFIQAFRMKPDGKGESLKLDHPPDLTQQGRAYCWLHMCAFENSTREYFENHIALDPIIVDAMLARETRPRALVKDDGALIILRAMNLHDGNDPEDMISIRIWIEDNKIITTRRRDIQAIDDIVKSIQNGEGPTTPGDFLTMITDRVFERMEPFFIDLEDRISKAEELLASGENDVAEDASMREKAHCNIHALCYSAKESVGNAFELQSTVAIGGAQGTSCRKFGPGHALCRRVA